jgi:xenotropic and polytropic retrovirus receptor 1
MSTTLFAQSPPVLIPETRQDSQPQSSQTSPDGSPQEDTPLQPARSARYGSIIGSPPNEPARLPSLDLPDPALPSRQQTDLSTTLPPPAQTTKPDNQSPYHVGGNARKDSLAQRMFKRRQHGSQPPGNNPGTVRAVSQSRLRRMFRPAPSRTPTGNDIQMEAYEKLDARQDEFFSFLDKELKKIEDFYKFKEEEANDRLRVIRQQLHELRDHRLEEVRSLENQTQSADQNNPDGYADKHKGSLSKVNDYGAAAFKPFGDFVSGKSKIGRVTKSLQQHTSPQMQVNGHDNGRASQEGHADFVRRQHVPSYRMAKRRLKMAMQEYYRGLELLKSYSLLNQTAFRKINKKYDKAINARPPLRYYSEYVLEAYFVKSDVVSSHMVTVEDLYSRYFEKGNHKVAVRKLRSNLKAGDFSGVSFRNGLWLSAGAVLGIAGVVEGFKLLYRSEGAKATQTSYLLQLHGGYFLAVLLALLFVLNCRIWKANRINYAFVFEFDPRNMLDWRQLAELPCFFVFLQGLIVYVNFRYPDTSIFLYWPVFLIGFTLLVFAIPLKIIYPYARKWWAYSNWRLLCAGLYPVEFRDFYLGDMYTSSTYTMSQISLFFCLYAQDWRNPPQCNSNHSRLLGFFTTLPAIFRALQCLRRFKDSRNWFPHMANFAKYCGNILYYTTLSLYRIDMSSKTRAAFITFACFNAVYCTIWDIFMDWSLGDWVSNNKFLRARLAYKRRRIYYAAIVLDIVLRQQWIVYAIFTEDLQHSSAASFIVALAEVFRRGVWSLFRVENEHCNNVDKFRASRDVPLPYKLAEDERPSIEHPPDMTPLPVSDGVAAAAGVSSATGADVERQRTDDSGATGSLRRRRDGAGQTPTFRALARFATVLASAHSQDFEKRKRPTGQNGPEDEPLYAGESSDEDDDDEDHHHRHSSSVAGGGTSGRGARSENLEEETERRQSDDMEDRENIGQARELIRNATYS